jgi:hypothetical protein
MGDKAIKGLSPILRKLIKEDNDIDTMEEAIAHLTGLTNDNPKRQKKLAFGVKAANREKQRDKVKNNEKS